MYSSLFHAVQHKNINSKVTLKDWIKGQATHKMWGQI